MGRDSTSEVFNDLLTVAEGIEKRALWPFAPPIDKDLSRSQDVTKPKDWKSDLKPEISKPKPPKRRPLPSEPESSVVAYEKLFLSIPLNKWKYKPDYIYGYLAKTGGWSADGGKLLIQSPDYTSQQFRFLINRDRRHWADAVPMTPTPNMKQLALNLYQRDVDRRGLKGDMQKYFEREELRKGDQGKLFGEPSKDPNQPNLWDIPIQ